MLRENQEKEKIEELGKESFRAMEEIARESNSETVDLIVDHELNGVTPEMLDWWWDHINNTERYKLWHPNDHISFKWEKSPENGHVGAIQSVIETVKVPTLLRIRWEDPNLIPIKATYNHVLAGSVLDINDNSLSWILHEYESIIDGIKLRTTFRLPAKTPRWFIKALHKHNIEEISQFINFLPKLYEENK
ncbi:MAG TPA: phloretin hydrolase [Candidatus Lokiarchaeia archaeon]